MNKIHMSSDLLAPLTGTCSILHGEETKPGELLVFDAEKRHLPEGTMFIREESGASKDASRNHFRVNIPCLGKDPLTKKSVTATLTLTTEREALRGGVCAITYDAGGNPTAVANNASGASLVALRTLFALAASQLTEQARKDQVGDVVVIDGNLAHDFTGLSARDGGVRFSSPFVRGQLGLPMITNDMNVGGMILEDNSLTAVEQLTV